LFEKCCWALALAVARQRGDGGSRPLPDTAAVTAALIAASAFAVVGGAIALTGLPASPASGCLLATQAAITRLWPRRRKPAFTAFKQTAAAARMVTAQRGRPVGLLTGECQSARVKQAHGR
jgi:hypothetical protein